MILAAEIPAKPLAPSTAINGLSVDVAWTKPDNGGSAITSYVIKIRGTNLSFYAGTCDQTTAVQLTTLVCTIPIADILVSPFNLAWGVSVYAKVIAVNVYGESIESDEGNGATILTIPDAPTNLANNPSITTGSKIGLSWAQGLNDGGTHVIDFTLSYKKDSGSYSILESAIVTQTYTAVGLTMGSTYTFKVQARNAYGLSPFSSEVSVLAAEIPAPPSTPVTTISGSSVQITWTIPSAGGSAITSLVILIRHSDGVNFSTEPIDCDGKSSTIVLSNTCSIPISTLRQSPFNLPWGGSVHAKVVAKNIYGSSAESGVGNGAVLLTNPDEPTDLEETY